MLDARIVKHRSRFAIDVSLRVGPGEASGLFGASGTGKSTILACIAGALVASLLQGFRHHWAAQVVWSLVEMGEGLCAILLAGTALCT